MTVVVMPLGLSNTWLTKSVDFAQYKTSKTEFEAVQNQIKGLSIISKCVEPILTFFRRLMVDIDVVS
jgi:hypothetical protein